MLNSRHRRKRGTHRSAAAPRDAVSTRDQILTAAYRTLIDVGYNQISMRKIADEAGVNQSLLHYYYGSKENLMLEVLGYINQQLLARQRKMYQEVKSFEAIWAQALEYFKEDVQSGYVRALWELRAQGLSNARIQTRLSEMIGHWRSLVTELAKNALVEYGIETKMRPEVFGRALGDIYWGAEAEILAGEDPHTHIEAIRLMGNLFRWIAGGQPRKTREAAAGGS
jgi:AcrR family transcriptional regulator